VDCDVHPAPASDEELRSFLPEPWRSRNIPDLVFSRGATPAFRMPPVRWWGDDKVPAGGGTPGSDPQLMDAQLLRDDGVDIAILIPLILPPPNDMVNPEYEGAVCAALNEWQDQLWLKRYNAHGRYRGTIVLPSDSALAVQEIEKWAGNTNFVQVMPGSTRGRPLALYEAAARHGLPLAFHGGGMGARSSLVANSYYIEQHTRLPLSGLNNIAHFVFDGVFERVPNLKVVLVETGFAWVAPLIWRMDRHWEALRSEVPWVRRRPSEYVQDHIRLTSQPIEEPAEPEHFELLFNMIGGERLLLFSSDYPHWDYDNPKAALKRVPAARREAVMAGNALDLYKTLPRLVDPLPPMAMPTQAAPASRQAMTQATSYSD
jgi:predicted TIM-barrel fold metal-dependent hydrolase